MTETTKQVKKVLLCDNVLRKVIRAEVYRELREIIAGIYSKTEEEFFSYYWIAFKHSENKGYYNTKYGIAIPVQDRYDELKEKYFNRECCTVSRDAIRNIFDKNCPREILSAVNVSKDSSGCHWVGNDEFSYCLETTQYSDMKNDAAVPVGFVSISLSDFKKAVLSQTFRTDPDKVYSKAAEIIGERSLSALSEKEIDDLIILFEIDREKTEKQIVEKLLNGFVLSGESDQLFRDVLVSCDKIRADLDKYDKKCLDDVNSGHWDLWTDDEITAEKGQITAELEKPLTARNPAADIHYDGLIGIDFGTKSTIVSRQDGKEKTTLIRVGTGNLESAAESTHYENPAILEFIDLEKFMSDYRSGNGRPDTSYDDVRVSHTAENDMKTHVNSDDFYSYFYDIKKWTADTEKSVKITDQRGREHILPAFVRIGENEFDPLEIYAYYLGLYINNMRSGIFIDYIMSFPVTYNKAVKEKIIESFTRGLKKSLPGTVLKDQDIMSKFRVREGVSEPAAYAITALQGYGFEPDADERIFYSIFDFGGGTTDFDFGLWRLSDESRREEERFDYVIEHLGSEGDRNLGGENLLELMAFELFRANICLLGRNEKSGREDASAGFSFTRPKECDDFPGSETFISNSQEARRNTRQLMEALRPFWEGICDIDSGECTDDTVSYGGYLFRNTEKCRFPFADGAIETDLFDKEGNLRPKQRLFISNPELGINVDLIGILESRIEKGVSNFFTSLSGVLRSRDLISGGITDIQIFLAGNSSRSPVLKKIFRSYTDAPEKVLSENVRCCIYPPLGTREAAEIRKSRGLRNDEYDVSAPTGKTGVAYGLISGREGGKIKVISESDLMEQTRFRYNIGTSKRGKFSIKIDRNSDSSCQWVRFTDAGSEDFELYYSSLPNAAVMNIDESGIYKKRCRISEIRPDMDIYIRCAADSPEDIEYCVSDSDTPGDSTEIFRVHLE